MQLERDAFDEVTQIIRTSYSLRIRRRRGTAYCNRPAMGVVLMRQGFALLFSQDYRGISIDDGAEYTESLARGEQSGSWQ